MSITLSDGTDTVTLSPDVNWTDEFKWSPVKQTVTPSLSGALILQTGTLQAGRPITLESSDDAAWMHRDTVAGLLRNWSAVPGMSLVLTLRGTTRNVAFRHQDGVAFEANALLLFSDSDVDDSDYYTYVLRLMEI